MKHYVCTNCGFWQRFFEIPRACPVCLDFRHTPPENGWEFLDFETAKTRFTTTWSEDELGVISFQTAPKLGIGPSGYLIPAVGGNLAFESCGFYCDAALDFIASRGGIALWSASHPHAYGAAWQLQERFSPVVAIQTRDLGWTNTLRVSRPFDEELEVAPGAHLIHSGGHFDGHSVLHLAQKSAFFAGDMLKFHFEGGRFAGISTHKGFNRGIPMSHAEVRRYQSIVQGWEFEHVYSSFERAPDGCRAEVLRLFSAQLSGAPFFGPLPIA